MNVASLVKKVKLSVLICIMLVDAVRLLIKL